MWQKLIEEMLAIDGWTESRIAERCKTSQPNINRLKKGEQKTTNFETGRLLFELHTELCPKQIPDRRSKRARIA